MQRPRINPRVIRDALATYDATGNAQGTARTTGVSRRSLERWITYRDTLNRPWPTQDDIDHWEADEEANRATRDRRAAHAYRYRQLRYLKGGPLQVPAIGTTRRLQALAAHGWTGTEIAERLGVTPARVNHLMSGMFPTVFPDTAEKVSQVFDELCMIVPQDDPPTRRGEIRLHERQRRWAARRGFSPPLAWDDIDDPDETPNLDGGVAHPKDKQGRPFLLPSRLEDIEFLADQGARVEEIADRLGLHKSTIRDFCARGDRLDLYDRLISREPDADMRRGVRDTQRNRVA